MRQGVLMMRSFEFGKPELRDTQVPSEAIPVIILHWREELYYGGGLSPLDMRKHLEQPLRSELFPKSVVRAWVANATRWSESREAFPKLLREYHLIERVA